MKFERRQGKRSNRVSSFWLCAVGNSAAVFLLLFFPFFVDTTICLFFVLISFGYRFVSFLGLFVCRCARITLTAEQIVISFSVEWQLAPAEKQRISLNLHKPPPMCVHCLFSTSIPTARKQQKSFQIYGLWINFHKLCAYWHNGLNTHTYIFSRSFTATSNVEWHILIAWITATYVFIICNDRMRALIAWHLSMKRLFGNWKAGTHL